MGENTAIAYAHDTFNGWIGCTEVPGNPQCGRCYAREMSKFRGWAQWGDAHPRMLTSEGTWRKPFRWNREAQRSGQQRRVFAFSLGDVFDQMAPGWPADRRWPMDKALVDRGDRVPARNVFFHGIVKATPHLTWMIFSKRYEAAADYLNGLWGSAPWPNVWVVFSAGTQLNLDDARAAHAKFGAVVHGISTEPTFERLDFGSFGPINWVIGGTESGHGARHTDRLDWFRDIADQSQNHSVAFYMKQITNTRGQQIPIGDWEQRLRVREFPAACAE